MSLCADERGGDRTKVEGFGHEALRGENIRDGPDGETDVIRLRTPGIAEGTLDDAYCRLPALTLLLDLGSVRGTEDQGLDR